MVQLPADRPRPSSPTFAASTRSFSISEGLLDGIRAVSKRLRVNQQTVFLSVLDLVLMKYSSSEDVVVGVPMAGRDQVETQNLVGYLINTLPVRLTALEGDRFEDVVKRVSNTMMGCIRHGALPLADIVQVSGVERIPNTNPLFQVMAQYLGQDDEAASEDMKLADIKCMPTSLVSVQQQAKMDLVVTFGGGTLVIEYMSELFDDATIDRLAASFETVLAHIVHSPDSLVSQVPIVSESDKAVVCSFASRGGTYNLSTSTAPLVHHAFEQAAARHPGKTCLVFEGEVMTYGEVNSRANQLASLLIGKGVGLGSVVGIMLHRSFELVISILAALKTGGAFFPASRRTLSCCVVLFFVSFCVCMCA